MHRSPDLTMANYRALAEFRYQLRRFLRFSEQAAREIGLEPQHHQLMLAVKGMPIEGQNRVAELAERLQLEHHSVVELVNRLVSRGLVAKIRSAEDRREVHVQLTARGERLLRELTLYMNAELRTAAPALVSALRKVMRRGRAHATQSARSKKPLPTGKELGAGTH